MRISDWSSDVCSSDLAAGEGFVDQHAAGCQRRRQRGEQRPVQVVRHHDAAEAAGEEAGRLVALEIARERLQPWVAGQCAEPREVTVDRQNRMAAPEIGRASWRERVCQYV